MGSVSQFMPQLMGSYPHRLANLKLHLMINRNLGQSTVVLCRNVRIATHLERMCSSEVMPARVIYTAGWPNTSQRDTVHFNGKRIFVVFVTNFNLLDSLFYDDMVNFDYQI